MKEIFIEREENILRIVVRENNELKECYIEEENNNPLPGNIYLGIVKSIVPAIKCAFVDIGYKKNCYMYLDRKFNNTRFKKGDYIPVQIVKEDVGSKGPKVTNIISIPGRLCVLDTLNNNISFSQKIDNLDFKKDILKNLKKPDDIGVIIRTNAQECDINIINNEVKLLYETYNRIKGNLSYELKSGLIYNQGGMLSSILKNKLDRSISKIYTNNDQDYEFIQSFVKMYSDIDISICIYDGERTLLDYYGIERAILNLRNSKVSLECGGFIIIEKTEAMYVIDVNSGKNTKHDSIKETAFFTNMQAAYEAARQIRLRNLSGIIIIDFIDMQEEKYQNKVMEELAKGFDDDKSKVVIYPFTKLNLVQIARRRQGKTIYDYIEEECSECKGLGKRVKLAYLMMLIKNEIAKIDSQRDIKNIYIQISEKYKKDIEGNILNFIANIGALEKAIYINYIKGDDNYKVEGLIFKSQIEPLSSYKVYG